MKTLFIFMAVLMLFGCAPTTPDPEMRQFTTVAGTFDESTVYAVTEGVGANHGQKQYFYNIPPESNLGWPFTIHSFRFKPSPSSDWQTITSGIVLTENPQGFVRVYGNNRSMHGMGYELIVENL